MNRKYNKYIENLLLYPKESLHLPKKNDDMITIELKEGALFALPSFTLSHTLSVSRKEARWMPAAEIVEALQQEGINISKQTLFLHEQAGKLHTKRISARKVYFELNEALEHFNNNR